MEKDRDGLRVVTIETADKMTEPQIIAKVKTEIGAG
jgi:hypothetical protein